MPTQRTSTMATCLAVIPVRLKSARLPGKPLADIEGQSLVERVWRQAQGAQRVSQAVIATEDREIFDRAESFGAKALMTKSDHRTGSDRVAEAARVLSASNSFDLVANIQGDLPFIKPEVIDRTIAALAEADSAFGISTVAIPILDRKEFERPSAVKVALGEEGRALYFSRAPIPYPRDGIPGEASEDAPFGYKHLGLYVFRPWALERLASLPSSLVEERERLEQLRALSHGIPIRCAVLPLSLVQPQIEVDTPEDLERARQIAKGVKPQS